MQIHLFSLHLKNSYLHFYRYFEFKVCLDMFSGADLWTKRDSFLSVLIINHVPICFHSGSTVIETLQDQTKSDKYSGSGTRHFLSKKPIKEAIQFNLEPCTEAEWQRYPVLPHLSFGGGL